MRDNLDWIQKLLNEMEQMRPLVNAITNIAERTNLLALNAVIQASNAGKNGKSFAVHSLFLSDTARLRDAIYQTVYPGLHLIPASPLYEHGSGFGDPTRLARALRDEQIDAEYDLILIDSPPSFDDSAHDLKVLRRFSCFNFSG